MARRALLEQGADRLMTALRGAQGCIDLKLGSWGAAATAAGARTREMRFIQKASPY